MATISRDPIRDKLHVFMVGHGKNRWVITIPHEITDNGNMPTHLPEAMPYIRDALSAY